MRANKAAKCIAKEMFQLCQVIEENGHRNSPSSYEITITFGDLFKIYQFISDKLVGILLRARKHNMLHFEGEMLFQRRDEQKVIHLLLNHQQILLGLAQH
uniref:Costars domain-containing protein n=1 Tax=Ditylenchus dipsaci TaxID=166011 RepID=A0A915E460_9BILA